MTHADKENKHTKDMIKYLHEIGGEFPVSVDIKIGYRQGRWGAIAFLPDISVRCSKVESGSSLDRFCISCVSPYVDDPDEQDRQVSALFSAITEVIAREDPEDHIIN